MLCPGCGKSVSLKDGKVSLCDECRSNQPVHDIADDKNSRSYLSSQEEDISSLLVAGFWLRVAAFVIDLAAIYLFWLVFASTILLGMVSLLSPSLSTNLLLFIGIIITLSPLFVFFCLPLLFEISRMQGTIGKYLVGIMIVNEDGSKMGILKTIGRSIVRSLSFVFLGIGFLFAASPPNKQAIHDMLFATKVVKFKEVPLKIILAYLVPAVIVSMLIGYFSDNKKSKPASESFTINLDIPQTHIHLNSTDVTRSEVVQVVSSPALIPSRRLSSSPVATKKKKEFADLPEFERRRIQALMLRDGTAK